jgi:hypothetical protein
MHPPFFAVDHKIGPDIHHIGAYRPAVKRGRPMRLDLTPVAVGWPPAPLVATFEGTSRAPDLRTHLRIVPPPQHTWRDWLGRLLIRIGQRLILQNRLG